MPKYDKFNDQSRLQARPWKIHPIWRGIGCILMIIIPVLAYAGAVLLVRENTVQRWLPMPRELTQPMTLPLVGTVDNFIAVMMVTLLLMLISFGMLTIIYSLIYSALGPPRLGPLDAPPVRTSPKKKAYKK
jgi:hypothetical protein